MVIENLDPMIMEWFGDRLTSLIDNNLDVMVFAGAAGLYGFLKNELTRNSNNTF